LAEDGAVAWLHAGDVTNGPTAVQDDSDPLADPLRVEVAAWFARRSVPIFLVRGNHDVTDDFRAFQSGIDVTGLVLPLAPRLFVAGIGWHGERYFELPMEADLELVCDAVRRQARRKLMPRDRLVLLTHYPPRHPEFREVRGDRDGAGVWFDCVRRLVDELRPLAVVQGHVHRWFRTAHPVPGSWGATVLVVNPGPPGAIVTVDVDHGTAEHEWVEAET
jgi:Icc-related predicted phosphoesterase